MNQVLLSTGCGFAVGALFAMLKLPIPAPPTLGAVMGVVGIYLGSVFMQTFF